MHVRGGGLPLQSSLPRPSTYPKGHPVKAHLKNAVITTAMVLAVIYAARQVSFTRGVVDKALQG